MTWNVHPVRLCVCMEGDIGRTGICPAMPAANVDMCVAHLLCVTEGAEVCPRAVVSVAANEIVKAVWIDLCRTLGRTGIPTCAECHGPLHTGNNVVAMARIGYTLHSNNLHHGTLPLSEEDTKCKEAKPVLECPPGASP